MKFKKQKPNSYDNTFYSEYTQVVSQSYCIAADHRLIYLCFKAASISLTEPQWLALGSSNSPQQQQIFGGQTAIYFNSSSSGGECGGSYDRS